MEREIEAVSPYDPRSHAYGVGVELARRLREDGQARQRRTHIRRRIVHIINTEERIVTEEEITTEEDAFGRNLMGGDYR
ncbi:hypothetical protein OG194_20970 [Streptomyces sp. NBC_01288]|uniref:hypothetical protein n=1 Tax=Streptomyces sp. NBC_01288 TaxID=2903814 RepID=UPI002E0E0959|nr:hypothetical protein OG194_20970 [Streptomyces sp. NBC_01288]